MTTSSSLSGGAPSEIVNGLSPSDSCQLVPKVGAPIAGLPTGSPSGPMMRAKPSIETSASATPSTSSTSSSRLSSIRPRTSPPPPKPWSISWFERTTASVSA
jgi:hypothetical protein